MSEGGVGEGGGVVVAGGRTTWPHPSPSWGAICCRFNTHAHARTSTDSHLPMEVWEGLKVLSANLPATALTNFFKSV